MLLLIVSASLVLSTVSLGPYVRFRISIFQHLEYHYRRPHGICPGMLIMRLSISNFYLLVSGRYPKQITRYRARLGYQLFLPCIGSPKAVRRRFRPRSTVERLA